MSRGLGKRQRQLLELVIEEHRRVADIKHEEWCRADGSLPFGLAVIRVAKAEGINPRGGRSRSDEWQVDEDGNRVLCAEFGPQDPLYMAMYRAARSLEARGLVESTKDDFGSLRLRVKQAALALNT